MKQHAIYCTSPRLNPATRTILLGAALLLLAAAPARAQSGEYAFRRVVPMGMEALRLDPVGRSLYLLASVDAETFEGMKRIGQGGRAMLLTPAGKRVAQYPSTLTFRVTASLREAKLQETVRSPIEVRGVPEQLVLGLTFRLKFYRALEHRLVEPSSVKLIGVPADLPYEDRVYRVQFDVGKVPISDRTVLEVLAPDGTRLARFHLDLM